MTSLRMRVVEAGARAYLRAYELPNKYPYLEDDEEWAKFWADRYPGTGVEDEKRAFAAAADGILDCLTENADEWQNEIIGIAHALAAPSKAELNRALQVLREDR